MKEYSFGSDNAALAMVETLSKFDNWKFKNTYARAVHNFDTHISNLMKTNMDSHSKAFYLEQLMPNIVTSFNYIRDSYRGKKGAYHMNFACGKAVGHFRFKIAEARREITKTI